MIEYLVGNLIDEGKKNNIQVIAHCANCMNTMKSGIAPQIVKAFPYAQEADLATVRADRKKLGTFSVGIAEPEDYDTLGYNCPDVFNLYGQYGFTKRQQGLRDLDYDAMFNSLQAMSFKLIDWGAEDLIIGLPAIGCGLAGAKWSIVEAMIKETLCLTENRIVVYSLTKEAMENLRSYK